VPHLYGGCLPLFVVIVFLIKIDSQEPVLFRQVRVGRGFCQFCLCKFRTMVQDLFREGLVLTIGEELRLIRIGRFLSQFQFDVLHQFFDVLKGDKCFVGPRSRSTGLC